MKLKQVCSLSADYGLNISADSYVDGGVPMIRTSDFDDMGRLALSEAKAVSLADACDKFLENGDVLFSRSGTVGRCMIFEETKPCTFAAYLVRFRPRNTQAHPKFIFYWAQSKGFQYQVSVETIESTIGNFNGAKFASLEFPQLPLGEQRAIAEFLTRETERIDQLIERREAFLSLIDEKKASLAVKAVDGSILEGVAKGIEGWFGALPASWQVKRAKFLFRERQDRSESGEEELLTVSHITGVTRRSDKDVNMFLAESMEGYKLVAEGDVAINTMWAWMGAMGVSPVEGLISPSYGVYAPRGDAFEADYLDLLLRSRPFVAEATRRSKGIHSSRLRLYPDAFLDILLPVPSREAQRAILTALKAATEREEQLATLSRLSLDRLREFRAALITAAVTGQIDVATWGERGEADRRLDRIEEKMRA